MPRLTKKELLIQRIIPSILAVLAVCIIVPTLILFMLGFRLDSDNGRLQQGALLQFDSTPNAANVSIDGKDTGTRTATKHTVLAGHHSFVVSKALYHDWKKDLTLTAGTLTWLDYIRLVPKDLPVESVATYETLYGAKASPDKKTFIIQEKADTPLFHLANLESLKVAFKQTLLPVEVYSEAETAGVAHAFGMQQWDNSGRYLLVQHTFGESTEWIIFDTQRPAESVNISRVVGVSLRNIQFASTNGKVLYGLTDDNSLRRIDITARTISHPLITQVSQYSLFGNNVISYIGIDATDATAQVAGVYREGDETPHILRSVPSLDTPLRIQVGRYYSDDYVAVAEGAKVTLFKGSYPTSSQMNATSLKELTSFALASPVTNLSFSPKNSMFLVAQSTSDFTSYEIEHKRLASGSIKPSQSQLSWLDGAYLWDDGGDTLAIREFDGLNGNVLNPVAPGYGVTLSQNGRFIYSIGKSGTSYQLQRITMILE